YAFASVTEQGSRKPQFHFESPRVHRTLNLCGCLLPSPYQNKLRPSYRLSQCSYVLGITVCAGLRRSPGILLCNFWEIYLRTNTPALSPDLVSCIRRISQSRLGHSASLSAPEFSISTCRIQSPYSHCSNPSPPRQRSVALPSRTGPIIHISPSLGARGNRASKL